MTDRPLLAPCAPRAIFYQVVEHIIKGKAPRPLDAVYGALADPTRRAIIAHLRARAATVGDLVDRFPISFNGVSKHVKVLERAGLVHRSVRGREHWLSLKPGALRGAARWLEHYREFWAGRVDALDAYLGKRRSKA
jgi:DNA-binding transcriptional ArsR family regulator